MDREALEQRLREMFSREGRSLVAAYLFGSQASGRAHRESDVDVGLLIGYPGLPTAAARFEERLRLVALLETVAGGAEIDAVVLNDVPPGLARHVVLDGRRVFCSDEASDRAFRRDVQLRAADLEPFLRRTRERKLGAIVR